jgi:glutamate-ammonia-ligase adenylyltransferase
MSSDVTKARVDFPEKIRHILEHTHLREPDRALSNVHAILAKLGAELARDFLSPLARILVRSPDPDMALNGLERFFEQPAAMAQAPMLLEHRGRLLETLVQLLGTSHFFSDLLTVNPDYLDMLKVPLRRSPNPTELQDQLQAEVDAAFEDSAVLRVFRRFRQRQILRIGTNDIIRERPLEEITRDISRVADAALEVALATAMRTVSNRFGKPHSSSNQQARCVFLAFGKHGGEELNYSSDVDLMFLYDQEGTTKGRRSSAISNQEFFDRVVGESVRLLSAHTDRGQAYRIDLRLRPEGHRGPLARSLAGALSYYDTLGRTWERQALIKVRPVAGDLALGNEFLQAIEPFVYGKYLSFAEINEIKALKRRIEQKTALSGSGNRDVKTGQGGIRDIEFTIQFLQLLNAVDLPELRQRNTLLAMQALERAGCLTDQEYQILDDAYRFLRKTEHRLQLLFDLQTHELPTGDEELSKLALRMGYGQLADTSSASAPSSVLQRFVADYREKTDLDRKILNHLLHQTFQGEDGRAEPESDLILDPQPDQATIHAVLDRYGFRDVPGAYNNLVQLAQESGPFLSTRRCRHFLASIAPHLLRSLAETPDPDMGLVTLEKVTASLGAKAILWELFSFSPPSLKLYVDICAWSDFLSGILINNPGMIDELLDSLVLNQPKSGSELREELAVLCRGATDLDPILHSFQDAELLRIGVRDILDKDNIQATTSALSDLAEVLLAQICSAIFPHLVKRFGIPALEEGLKRPCRFAILGLGKLGGRELGYHSDLDLILVYEGDGRTKPPPEASRFDHFDLTDNFHFFTEVAQRIIKMTSAIGPLGRLYHIDMRLRPTGKSGSLVTPLTEFRRYYEEGDCQVWERQALTRARIVYGDEQFGKEVLTAAQQGAYLRDWRPEIADQIREMRERLEASRNERDLKRGFGGIVDVEFLVQLFQLKYGHNSPHLRAANTWQALSALELAGLLDPTQATILRKGYGFLRLVESRLRMVHNRAMDEVPQAPEELEKLARRLGYEANQQKPAAAIFLEALEATTTQIREVFSALVERER